jgi:hypothetical protein
MKGYMPPASYPHYCFVSASEHVIPVPPKLPYPNFVGKLHVTHGHWQTLNISQSSHAQFVTLFSPELSGDNSMKDYTAHMLLSIWCTLCTSFLVPVPPKLLCPNFVGRMNLGSDQLVNHNTKPTKPQKLTRSLAWYMPKKPRMQERCHGVVGPLSPSWTKLPSMTELASLKSIKTSADDSPNRKAETVEAISSENFEIPWQALPWMADNLDVCLAWGASRMLWEANNCDEQDQQVSQSSGRMALLDSWCQWLLPLMVFGTVTTLVRNKMEDL